MLMTTAMLCLAMNIYHEARGESLMGQHAVAQVTMNRAARDPKKVCREVTRYKQFSWTMGLLKKRNGVWVVTQRGLPKEKKAWRRAKRIAQMTLAGRVKDFTRGATHYHEKTLKPYWSESLTVIATIGNHRFYA